MISIYPPGSRDGNYKVQGNIAGADCVIGNEFGYRLDGPGLVNEALARFTLENFSHLPLILNKSIADPLQKMRPDIQIAQIFDGISTNYTGTKGAGTFGELAYALAYMRANNLHNPIIVAQAYHVGRVALSAKIEHLPTPIIPEGLPRDFDPGSVQPWIHSEEDWIRRERLVGLYVRGVQAVRLAQTAMEYLPGFHQKAA